MTIMVYLHKSIDIYSWNTTITIYILNSCLRLNTIIPSPIQEFRTHTNEKEWEDIEGSRALKLICWKHLKASSFVDPEQETRKRFSHLSSFAIKPLCSENQSTTKKPPLHEKISSFYLIAFAQFHFKRFLFFTSPFFLQWKIGSPPMKIPFTLLFTILHFAYLSPTNEVFKI